MGTPTVYVICDTNCKFEGMTKEQILTAITQAVQNGTIGDIDTGFITTIKTINNTAVKFFYGSQSEYNALSAEEKLNLFKMLTDDTTLEDLLEWKRKVTDGEINILQDSLGYTPPQVIDENGKIVKYIKFEKPSSTILNIITENEIPEN